jgi:hypothetical protein
MSRIDDWLQKYSSGPRGHDYEDAGGRGMPFAQSVQPGQRLDSSTMEHIAQCKSCGKPGRRRTFTCEICETYPAGITPGRVLVLPDGTKQSDLPLCDVCHVDIISGQGGGCAIEWEVTE